MSNSSMDASLVVVSVVVVVVVVDDGAADSLCSGMLSERRSRPKVWRAEKEESSPIFSFIVNVCVDNSIVDLNMNMNINMDMDMDMNNKM